MSASRVFYPKNRLAQIIGGAKDPAGKALEQAAQARVGALKESILAFVADQAEVIDELAAQRDEVLFAECIRLEKAALAICEVAGAAGLANLGEAARGVSVMVGALVSQGVWHTEALRLHMSAVARFTADPPPGAAEARQVLSNLSAMRERIGVR